MAALVRAGRSWRNEVVADMGAEVLLGLISAEPHSGESECGERAA